jgi:hypothetical protein
VPKRPDKTKLEVVKPPAGITFVDALVRGGRVSVYQQRITEALSTSGCVQIVVKDNYALMQLRKAAKALKVKLVYAISGEAMYIKPIAIEGEKQRLILLLRESRTLNYLRGKKLELHLENTLAELAKDGLAMVKGDEWRLTLKGMDLL